MLMHLGSCGWDEAQTDQDFINKRDDTFYGERVIPGMGLVVHLTEEQCVMLH